MEDILCYKEYRLIRTIYEDSERKIYVAEHPELNIRRLVKEAALGSEAEKIIRCEAKILSGISSSFIPAFCDLWETPDRLCLAEEYVEGETLESFLGSEPSITAEKLKRFLDSLCGALQALHQGRERFLHCDLKPSNLMVCGNILKLVDFGAAVPDGRENLGLTSFGTPSFAAPEQKNGEMRRAATDIYGAGKIAELLCAAYERSGGSRRLLKRLKAVTDRATGENTGFRFETALDLRAAFEQAFKGAGIFSGRRKNRDIQRKTIGIVGTHHGAGATHMALNLALSLADSGKDVALVDLSENGNLSCFVEKRSSGGAGPVRFRGISLYPGAGVEASAIARNGNYDHCIFDLGLGAGKRMQEFLRCDLKLIITDAAPWREDRRSIVERLARAAVSPRGWWLLVNFSERKRPKDLKALSVNMEWPDYNPDPFQNTPQNEILYGKLLSAY